MAKLVEPPVEDVLEFCARSPVERVFLEDVARRGFGHFVALRGGDRGGELTAVCHVGANVVPSGVGCGAFADATRRSRARMIIGEERAVGDLWRAAAGKMPPPREDRPGQPVYVIFEPPPAGDTGLRLATEADLPRLTALMDLAIGENLKPFLPPELIVASRAVMGLDTTLVADRTYFVVEDGPEIAGCGGWSRRATLYGGDHSAGRDAALLDPAVDAARVRAMYTHPDFARRGVGRLILRLCEDAARAEGFTRLELMGTMSGRPLYEAYGFVAIEDVVDARGGAPVPLTRMGKAI